MPPDRDDILYEIAGGIGRIEGKLDGMIEADKQSRQYFVDAINNLSNSTNKIVMALIAVIAANVGVEFIPNSPIDWVGATEFTGRWLLTFAMVFVSIQLLRTRKRRNGGLTCLAIALLSFAALVMITIYSGWARTGVGFFIGQALRLASTIGFSVYGWKIDTYPKPKELPPGIE